MSPNIGTLLKGFLVPNLLNNLLASCFLINLDFCYHKPHILTKTLCFHYLTL